MALPENDGGVTLTKRSSAASVAGAGGPDGSAMSTGSSGTTRGSVGDGLEGGVTTSSSLEYDDDNDGNGSDSGGKDGISGGGEKDVVEVEVRERAEHVVSTVRRQWP